ncbi:uncharacterized protein ACR2FA_011285 [Aphomia sociella]
MASKIILFLTLAFVALSNAGFVWVDDDNDDHPVFRPVRPKHPKFHKFEPITFKPFVFEPITFKPFVFEPITFKPIDVNYQPKDGEHYVAVSHSSHSESSDVNGVKSQSGGSDFASNVNGKVDEKGMEFKSGDDVSNENK